MKYRIYALAIMLMASATFLSSCDGDDDEGSTNEIVLRSYGPSPVMRGAKLKFIGVNLDKVTAVVLPSNIEVTTFVTKTSNVIEIDVPQETVPGKVTLKTPQGDIVAKTLLGISEPITIASITPASVRPGGTITIEGTYLNLVKTVIFAENKPVTEFTQTQSKIEVVVPEDAKTGPVVLSDLLPDAEEIPNLIESETELDVILPAVAALTPNTIRAGDTVALTGTNLDLVKDVTFQVGVRVQADAFVSQSATKIEIKVPANAQDGTLTIRPASAVEVATPALTMVVPAITSFDSPGKNNGTIEINGTNLDLVTSVTFAGGANGVNGEIQAGGSTTSITVKVPATAVDGTITLNTGSGKSVTTATELELVVPTLTGFTPTSVNTVDAPTITITGTDLDVVAKIVFGGEGWEADIADAITANDTEIEIPVTPGSLTGKITLVTTNGTEIVSANDLTIVPHVPNVTGVPAGGVSIGDKITLTGTNMDIPAIISFPGETGGWVVATHFGAKTSTTIEVYVPSKIVSGDNIRVRFVTDKNEVYLTPEFLILTSLPELIEVFYDDAIQNGFGQWGGNTDWSNNEQVRTGTSAMKITFPGGDWGIGGQFGGSDVSTTGATHFVFSAFGGPGTGGAALQILVKQTGSQGSTQVTLAEGQWTDYQIPLSELGDPANVVEFFFQDPPGLDGVVYIDHVGLK